MTQLLNDEDVDVLIDTHTTNGSLHRYDLTYAVPNNPIVAPAISQWLRDSMLRQSPRGSNPRASRRFTTATLKIDTLPGKAFGHEPRYSTEIMGLRGKIGILAESYSYAPYEKRIESTYQFVLETLAELNSNSAKVLKLIRDNRAVEVGTKIPVKAELARTADDVQALGYKAANGDLPQPPYGPESASKYRPEDYRVALWMHSKATKEIAVPQAYAVPVEAAWMVTRLLMHGVRVERLKQPADGIQCEVLTITEDERVTELQNHRLHSLK